MVCTMVNIYIEKKDSHEWMGKLVNVSERVNEWNVSERVNE